MKSILPRILSVILACSGSWLNCVADEGAPAKNFPKPPAHPRFEPEDPVPATAEIKKAWEGVPPGLHGTLGSLDVRYPRNAVPSGQQVMQWSTTAWRGERLSAQFVLWTAGGAEQVRLVASPLRGAEGKEVPAARIRGRFVRYSLSDAGPDTPVQLMPDALDTADRFNLAPRTVRPLWITVDVPAETPPGVYRGELVVKATGGAALAWNVAIEVLPLVLPPPSQWSFRLDLWQSPCSVAEFHKVERWSPAHWAILEPHLRMLADIGQRYATTYISQNIWADGGYVLDEGSMVKWIRGADGCFRYDYTAFDKYVELAARCGITEAIGCYTTLPWGNRCRFLDEASGEYVWQTHVPGSEGYKAIWTPFLKDFAAHLKQRGWFERAYIGLNENQLPEAKAAVDLLRKTAPGLKVTFPGRYKAELCRTFEDQTMFLIYEQDLPPQEMRERTKLGNTTTFYVCCGPAWPNNFTYSPPAESVWMGWHAVAGGYDGFARWSYDYWVADPLYDTRYAKFPAGDCQMVYPGVRSSIRFERLREGIVDYEKIRILRKLLAERRDGKVVEGLKRLDGVLSQFTVKVVEKTPAAQSVREGQNLLVELSRLAATPP